MSRSAYALARLVVVLAVFHAGLLAASPPALAQAADQANNPQQLYEDFCHNILIARPELAAQYGEQLLESADSETLLSVVESSDYQFNRVIDRAKKIDSSSNVASRLEQAVQNARIERARDEDRIAADIELLAEGDRANVNATARLKAAGQYAAPQLLATLHDPSKKNLHPFVIEAMVAIGEDLVYPLSVALPDLGDVQMVQVAQVLARIGYPAPIPYMKQVLETEGVAEDVKRNVRVAYSTLIADTSLSPDLTAAQLYTLLGQSHYNAGTRGEQVTGFDAANGTGIIWSYLSQPTPTLVMTQVPGPIYPDARALRDAKAALAQDPGLDPALSLYLASNFRRENRMPEGAQDPSYQEENPASFYAKLAGPERLHDVLNRALDDGDPALALDAINALSTTAGTEALTTTRESLLRGLTYPDRRVRFRSAEALAWTRPDKAFNSSYNVVKILADQVRQSDKQYAMILASDRETVNELLPAANELGYEAFGSTRIGDLTSDINNRPGVDLILIHDDADAVRALYAQTATDPKLRNTPIIPLVNAADQVRLRSDFSETPRVLPIVATTDPQELAPAVEEALSRVAGEPITPEEAQAFALSALMLLRDIAMSGSEVYSVLDAQPALEQALADDRDPVVMMAGHVLSLIGNESAQQKLFDAALAAQGEVQISLLNSLAQSAQQHGNLSAARQTDALLNLVKEAAGDTAIAAAQAHGSLMLSTDKAVTLINEE